MNRAFGEAHNAILNHLHLGPIIGYSYKAANKTGPVYVDETAKALANATGSHYTLSLRATLRQALKDARAAKRPGTILLASSADQEDIADAMASFTIGATPYRALDGTATLFTMMVDRQGWQEGLQLSGCDSR